MEEQKEQYYYHSFFFSDLESYIYCDFPGNNKDSVSKKQKLGYRVKMEFL